MLNVPASWRIRPSFLDLSPFGAGEHARPLRIIVDDKTAEPCDALDLIRSFSRRDGVEVSSVEFGDEHGPWDTIEARYVWPTGARTQTLGAAASWEDHARQEAAEFGLGVEETRRGLLLAQAAARHQIDALITNAAVLDTPGWKRVAERANRMSAEQACALLGLFLRARNDFTVCVERNVSTFIEFERFYRGAVISVTPHYEAWLHAVWSMWREGGNSEPFGLLRAVDARIGRALIARDYMNVRLRHWRPDETWDEVLYFFESFLLSLNGALDAFARLLHVALRLPQNRRRAGFQRADWRAELVAISSPLDELLGDDASFVGSVQAIGALRNFVHAEMLSDELLRDDGAGPEFMSYGKGVLVLHGEPAERLRRGVERAGSLEVWGVTEGFDEAIKVMPVLFGREALRQALIGLNRIMATQVLAVRVHQLATPWDPDFWVSTRKHSNALALLTGLAALTRT